MKKIFLVIMALVFGVSQIACATTGTQPQSRNVTVDTSSFNNNLNSSDSNVQAALDTLDQVLGQSGNVNWGDIGGLLSNQTDLQSALNSKISGVNWGQIGGVLSNQTDLQTALNAKVSTSTTINGHALTGNVTVTSSDVGLGNVQNVDTTIASNIVSGILSNARLANIPNTAINWTSLNQNIQTSGINWMSVKNMEIQSSGINWSSLFSIIQSGAINWASLNAVIQSTGINWTSLNKSIQSTGINWTSVNSSQMQANGINWTSLFQNVQATGVNWNSLSKSIQTTGINWTSVINQEIQSAGINWTSVINQVTENAFNFTNVTTANSTTSAHGLLPILPGSSSVYLNGSGAFTTPPGSGTINSSTVGYFGQYTGATTISGIQFIQASGINWTSLNTSQVQSNGVNWNSLIQNIQAGGVNWPSLNKSIQSPGINWTSLINSIQATGINWTSLVSNIQSTGVNWTSLTNNIQGTGINWASIIQLIQSGNINWPSVQSMQIQSAGINWSSVIQSIQAGAINWASVMAGQLQGAGVNWTSVGNVNTGGTFTTNGFNTVSTLAGLLKLYELPSNGNTYLGFQSPNSIPSSVTWTWPSADGVGCFQSNGSGTISIGTCGGGSGSGTVNTGTQYQLGYYAANGTAISGAANILTDASSDLNIGGSITTGGTGQSSLGYGLLVNSGSNTTINGGDFTFKNSTGTVIFNIGATSSNITIPVTGLTQCLHASAAGIVTGTGSDCGAGGGGLSSFTSPNNTIQIGGTLTNPTVDVNWTGVNGLASINTGGINWNSINSIAKMNAGGINWNSIINGQIQSLGVNWTSVINQQIQHQGINWASLNADIKSLGINWPSVNGGATINAGAFSSTTGSGNQVVLASSPTITTPNIATGIEDSNSNTIIGLTTTGSAVNSINVADSSTTNPPVISAIGSDTNIGITLTPKGSGIVNVTSSLNTGGTGQSSLAYGLLLNSGSNTSVAGADFETLNILGNPVLFAGATSGNVGIGTANPGTALDVQGTVRVLGLLNTNLPTSGGSTYACFNSAGLLVSQSGAC